MTRQSSEPGVLAGPTTFRQIPGRPGAKRKKRSSGSGVPGTAGHSDYQALEGRVLLAQVLPDLFSWADQSRGYMYDYVVEGNLLRFTTALANKGSGNLELRGGAVNAGNGTQEVWQRIYNDNGTFSDRLAGQFVYHPGHGHIHFDGYATYNLRAQLPNGDAGAIVATGGKVSFCLIDIAKYNSNAGSANYNSCGQIQGVTAGWTDVYNRSLPDQWINLTGVAPGNYFLEVVTDPFNQLVESDETNNVTRIPVVIPETVNNSGGDRYETNNSFVTATNLGMTSKFAFGGLSIHKASDVDYFQLVTPEHDHYEVEIGFSNGLGNLDLFVYDSQQTLVASSTSTEDVEKIEWTGEENEAFFIVVSGVGGAINGYEMYIHGHGELITEHVYSTTVPVTIPDSPGAAITSTVVGPNLLVSDLNLMLDNLEHTWLGDLRIELISPSGTVQTLIQNSSNGGFLGNEDNFFLTTLDDQAPTHLDNGTAPFRGSYRIGRTGVANPLAIFNGQNAAGTWTLRIRDYAAQDEGVLRNWGIAFTGVDQNPGDQYEPNDQFPQAVDLGTIGQAARTGLSIHRTNDADLFRFIAGMAAPATINLGFAHADGNLDLRVYDDDLQLVAVANSDDDDELLVVDVTAGRLYYVEVFSSEGTAGYDLSIDVARRIGGSYKLPTLGTEWVSVLFPSPVQNPVVAVSPLTMNDGAPAMVRIRNLDSSGFEIRIDEWDYQDGVHGSEAASYLVLEAGRHQLPDGTVLEAGTVDLSNGTSRSVEFSQPWSSPPVVLTQVLSENDPASVNSRLVGVKNRGFAVKLQEQESADGIHAVERVGWIAVSPGSGTNGTLDYESGVVTGVAPKIGFAHSFGSIPTLYAASQWMIDTDPVTLRTIQLDRFLARLEVQEEQSAEPDNTPAKEPVGWFAMSLGDWFVELETPARQLQSLEDSGVIGHAGSTNAAGLALQLTRVVDEGFAGLRDFPWSQSGTNTVVDQEKAPLSRALPVTLVQAATGPSLEDPGESTSRMNLRDWKESLTSESAGSSRKSSTGSAGTGNATAARLAISSANLNGKKVNA